MIFLSPQPHTLKTQSELTQWINILVLFLSTTWIVGKLPHYQHKPVPIPWNHSPVDCLTLSRDGTRNGRSDHVFNCLSSEAQLWLSLGKLEVTPEAIKSSLVVLG